MMKGKTMDELIAALEQAMCWGRFHGQGQGHGSPDDAKYLALIRAHIADLRAGGERAKVVAYIQSLDKGLLAMLPNTQRRLADAIASGAHMENNNAD
jgi:hypothetical protein